MLNTFLNLLPYLLIIISFNTIIFIFACIKKDNSIVDVFYSTLFMLATISAFCVSAYTSLITEDPFNYYNLIVLVFILTWGVRLGFRIYKKNMSKKEDFRYAVWRSLWMQKGSFYFYVRSYIQIFLLQGMLAFLIVSPVLYFILENILNRKNNIFFILFFIIGSIIWIIGFIFEYFGDKQLDDFLKDKEKLEKEKIITTGLWKYTRHPNYFGEAAMWWGLFVIVAPSLFLYYPQVCGMTMPPSSCFIYNKYFFTISYSYFILSPVIINYLLRFVSGVPMLEKKWDNHPDTETRNKWLEYKKKTPTMIPKIF